MADTETRRSKPVDPENLRGDLVARGDPRHGIIWINPKRMSGAPCFFGTRVPIQTLWDYLEGGETIDDFLRGFPGVTHEQVVAVIRLAGSRLIAAKRGRAA